MKKLIAVVAVVAVMGVVSGQADTTNIVSKQNVTIKGKLSPSGAAITGASLSGNTNVISHLTLQIISNGGASTNEEQWIGQVTGSATNLFLQQKENVDLTPLATKSDKWATVFKADAAVGTSTNAVIFTIGTTKVSVKNGVTNETVSAKFQGIWVTDSQIVTGTLGSAK